MGYFIHNKYDINSLSQVNSMVSAGHTIIDYYGLLENGDETHRDLNTFQMPELVTSLEYATINPSHFAPNTLIPDSSSQFKFESSIVVKSIQSGIVDNPKINELTEINISPVIPDKCSVRLEYGARGSGATIYTIDSTVTINKLILQGLQKNTGNNVGIYCRYEIVEYK